MKNNLINAGMLASLVIAETAPAVLPSLVFAQAIIHHEDLRADRQADRRTDYGSHGG
jgi:hypothetical protein